MISTNNSYKTVILLAVAFLFILSCYKKSEQASKACQHSLRNWEIITRLKHQKDKKLKMMNSIETNLNNTRKEPFVQLPTFYNFLPNLLREENALKPAYIKSKGRNDVFIILGLVTVQRNQSYLMSTLQSLVSNMNASERAETLIVVCIAERKMSSILSVANEIEAQMTQQIRSGLIDIIAPSPQFYPDFRHIRPTFNDSLERAIWRSKQNLDLAYIMAYAQTKGLFYVHLEDDIITVPQFITIMKGFTLEMSALTEKTQVPWLVLDFCELGMIGKLFRTINLNELIMIYLMFYAIKPADWILRSYVQMKTCGLIDRNCDIERLRHWHYHIPAIFQHNGVVSSLAGKTQTLKVHTFIDYYESETFYPHTNNPKAHLKSDIMTFEGHSLKDAYVGENFYWGIEPRKGDKLCFVFTRPVKLKYFLFRSGNAEYTEDRFYNTNVEILAENAFDPFVERMPYYTPTKDGFLVVGKFDAAGVAENKLDEDLGRIKEMRLHVQADADDWVILSEIDIRTM